ncbi:EmrB/QacA subfamily drug resistance transporter [Motilibacter rhizosphaerae]|uniref:EmrB/QacA subfamily drug resistance transporter n=2 Tax=Motilibacter rhizosphaerae TaxID=598652 RepID=A0A4Q7NUZ5_9ACTN|nr:MFS transporter [Motilibacter rhizosphaerae]RZS91041.1 EmrB/QacA subfamily drug resistance transporter [Motilibacter rhizosphaerae]
MSTTEPNRWMVLAVCCMSLLLVSLDVTIVNIALPAIRTDLYASLSGLQWTVDAYTLVLAMLLMLSGSLGDRLGRRRVFRVGLVLFTLGSLLCSIAPGLGWLVAFRMLQAVGGSMLNPVAMAILVNTFRDPAERARAIGVWGAVVGVSMSLGPIVGGVLVDGLGWRSIFWVNVPIGILALVLTGRVVPESRAPRARAVDPAGQALVVVLLGSLTYAIIEAPDRGWLSLSTVVLYAVAAAALVALLAVELRRREPLVELRFFRSVPFSAATLTAVAAFAALGTFLFVNTLYLQQVRHFSPVEAGLRTLPMAVLAGITAPLSGRLVATRGARVPLVLAGIATAAGALLLVRVSTTTPQAQLFAAYALIGLGFGLVNAPITNTATSGMPRAQAGVAAAVASTSRQVGASLGVAVSGSLVAGTEGARFASASHVVWILVAGCGIVVVALGLLATGARALGTAERTRALFEQEGAARELADA